MLRVTARDGPVELDSHFVKGSSVLANMVDTCTPGEESEALSFENYSTESFLLLTSVTNGSVPIVATRVLAEALSLADMLDMECLPRLVSAAVAEIERVCGDLRNGSSEPDEARELLLPFFARILP